MALALQVNHFKAMLERNRGNPQLSLQVKATLVQAHGELAAATAEQTRMRQSISGKEAQKKFWGKF